MGWSDAARAAAAEARRRNEILNRPIDALRRNKKGMMVMVKVAPSNRFKQSVLKKAAELQNSDKTNYTSKQNRTLFDRRLKGGR